MRNSFQQKKMLCPCTNPAEFDRHFSLGHLLLGWRPLSPAAGHRIGFQIAPEVCQADKGADAAIWQESHEGHGLVIGPTGSGKGRSSLATHLLTWPGPAVVIDPKGEMAAVTSRYRREVLGQRTVLLDPFHCYTTKPDSLNPLDAIQFSGESPEEFAIAALQLLHPDRATNSGGPSDQGYWQDQGDALLSAVLLHILTSPNEKEARTFARLRDLLMSDDVVYSLAVLLDTVGKTMPKMANGQIANFLSTTDVTRSGILSTAQQHLRLFADPCVTSALGHTSFDLAAFKRGEPMTIYLIIPPTRLVSHGLILRCWLATLLTVAMSREQVPAMPDLFLVDEVGALGAMDQLRTAFTLLRGYGIRVFLYMQGLEQIKRLYPSDWETFVNNAGTVQTFGVSNHLMARQLAEVFGKVSAEDLLALRDDEQYVLHHRGQINRCLKLDYLKDRIFKGRYSQNPRYAAQK